jgi:photosystem II stability/assembly factor-like uncharacterized protein
MVSLFFIVLQRTAVGQWTRSSGIGNSFIGSLSISGNNMIAAVGAQAPDSIFISTDNGNSWSFGSGDTVPLVVTSMVAVGTDLVVGSNNPGGSYFSTNLGHTWNSNTLNFPNPILTRYGISSLAAIGTTIFAATASGAYEQAVPGAAWTPDTVGMVPTGTGGLPSALSLFVSGSNFFMGTGEGGAYLSTNDGVSWSPISDGLPTSYFDGTTIYRFAAAGTAIFAVAIDTEQVSLDIYVTKNNGQFWSKANLQSYRWMNIPSFCSSGQNLFVAADSSVYVSSDNGANWVPSNEGFSPSNGDAGYVISMDTSGPNLVIGTFANGVWTRKLSDFGNSSVTASSIPYAGLSLSLSENPALGSEDKIIYTLSDAGTAEVMVMDELGHNVRMLQNGPAMSGQNIVVIDPLTFEPGTYFVRVVSNGMSAMQKLAIAR